MTGPGSGGNVLAALCSFFVPGLGQLLQGRLVAAAIQFLLSLVLWWVLLGWLIHIYSAYDAAVHVPRS
jgi:TM2 domain-containing membrane protein YozV